MIAYRRVASGCHWWGYSGGMDDYNPVCLHKDDGAYETRVGLCCPICGMIRHRHSQLVLVPLKTIGDITVSTSVAVPLKAPG